MNILFEAKYALRQLKKTPVFTATSVIIIAFSIAIALVVFTIDYRTLLKPLDFSDAHNWYSLQFFDKQTNTSLGAVGVDGYTYNAIKEKNYAAIDDIKAMRIGKSVLGDGEYSTALVSIAVDPKLLAASEVRPLLGRLLNADDGNNRSVSPVLLSYETWQNYYAGDVNVVGKTTRLDGTFHTVVGVLPEKYDLIFSADIWLPLHARIIAAPQPDMSLVPLVRLKDGQTLEAATREVNEVLKVLRRQFPDFYSESRSLTLVPLSMAPSISALPGFILLGLIAAILAIFGALNIGILLTARVLERNKELAIRTAVGSSRWRACTQNMWETSFLCAAGWLIGIGLTQATFTWSNPIFISSVTTIGVGFPDRWLLKFDLTSVLFSLFFTIFIWLLCSFAPSLRSLHQDIGLSLGGSSKGSNKARGTRAASLLVGFQTIIACFLLVVSGCLVMTFNAVITTDVGIERNDRIIANIDLESSFQTQLEKTQYVERLEQELAATTSLEQWAFVSSLPTEANRSVTYRLEDRNFRDDEPLQTQPLAAISNDYFATVGTDLVAGRPFDNTDTADSLQVMIVDIGFAETIWPGENAVGKRIQLDPENGGNWVTVVGVSSHIRTDDGFAPDNQYWFYRPLSQLDIPSLWLIAKTQQPITTVAPEIRAAAARIERDLPLTNIVTWGQYFTDNLHGLGFVNNLLMIVALLTLLLAVAGIFGILARSIINSTRDIGVRRAVGSGEGKIVRLYLRKGITFLIVGCLLGGYLAFLVNNSLFVGFISSTSNYFVNVAALVVGILTLCIVVASYMPVKKVVKMEPGDALHYE